MLQYTKTKPKQEGSGANVGLEVDVLEFRGGLVFKAHALSYHSTLGLRLIKKKKIWGSRRSRSGCPWEHPAVPRRARM